MKKINDLARSKIKNSNLREDMKKVITTLSMLVAVVVVSILIIPAISLTKAEYDSGTAQAPSSAEVGSLSKFNLPDSQISSIKFSDEGGNGTERNINFEISYGLNAGDVSLDKPYVLYPLTDANISVDKDFPSDVAWGKVWDGGVQSGVFHVYKGQNGQAFVLIQFFKEYLEQYTDEETGTTQAIGGTVNFNADVTRSEGNVSDNQDIIIGGHTINIAQFTPEEMSFNKRGTANDAGEITWTLDIANPERADLSNAVIEDSLIGSISSINVTPAGAATLQDGKIVLASGVNQKNISITYKTQAPADQMNAYYSNGGFNVRNEAKFITSTKTFEKTADAFVDNKRTISKTAETNYATNEYIWTVNVDNKHGVNLKGSYIEDPMLSDITLDKLQVYGVSKSDIEISGNRITFKEDVTDKNISFVYNTPVDLNATPNNQNVIGTNNQATFKTPNGDQLSNAQAWAEYKLPNLNKQGQKAGNQIKYNLTLETPNSSVTKDYYISDPAFEYANNFTIYRGWNPNNTLTEGTDYKIENNKFILLKDLTGADSDRINITYYINQTDDVPGKTYDEETKVTTFVNTAEYGKGDKKLGEKSSTVDVEPMDNLNKYIPAHKGVEKGELDADGKFPYVIPWGVLIEKNPGEIAGKTFKDVTYYDGETNTGAGETGYHYFNKDDLVVQIRTITNVDQNGNITYSYDEVDAKYYTVTEKADGGFEVYFKTEAEESGSPFATASAVVLEYTTTTISAADKKVTVENEAIFEEKTKKVDYTLDYNDTSAPYEKVGPEKVAIGNLEVVNDAIFGECYLIPYTIHYDGTGKDLGNAPVILSDKMPQIAGMNMPCMLYEAGGVEFWYNENYKFNITPGHWAGSYSFTPGSSTFNITLGDQTKKEKLDINYKLLISKAEFDALFETKESISFSNEICSLYHSKYPSSVAETEVTKGGTTPDPDEPGEEKHYIDKTGGQGATDGYAAYELDVNPDATAISTNGFIDIKDVLNLQTLSIQEAKQLYENATDSQFDQSIDLSKIRVTLDSIDVYEVTDSGLNKLASEDYTYTTAGVRKETVYTTCNYDLVKNGNEYSYTIPWDGTTVKTGSKVTIKITGEPGATVFADPGADGTIGWNLELLYSNYKVGSHAPWSNIHAGTITFDENGEYVFSFTYDGEENHDFKFKTWGNDEDNAKITSVSVKASIPEEQLLMPSLDLSVPDGKHLKVKYVYKLEYDTNAKRVAVKADNQATVYSPSGNDSSGNTSNISIKDATKATSFTKVPVKLNKINLNTASVNIEAGFNIYKFDAETNKWMIANEIHDKEERIGQVTYSTHVVEDGDWSGWKEASSGATGVMIRTNEYYINLEPETLYMLVEKETPNPYILLNDPKYITYNKGVTEEVLENAKTALSQVDASYHIESVENITNNIRIEDGKNVTSAGIDIKNRNYVNVNVSKKWSIPKSENTDDYRVKVGLYRTTGTGRVSKIPSDIGAALDLAADNGWVKVDDMYLDKDNSFAHTWYGDPTVTSTYNCIAPLESGTDDTIYYYYVIEELVEKNIDGTWTDVTNQYTCTINSDWQIVGTSGYSGDHTLGTITLANTNGLSIRKIWQDKDRVELTDSEIAGLGVSEIQVSLYRSTTQSQADAVKLTAADLEDIPGIKLKGDNIVLDSSNDWQTVLSGIPASDGVNSYYYYVVEESDVASLSNTVTSCEVVYSGTGVNQGEMTIYNVVSFERDSSVTLPHTGGVGTKLLYFLSLIVIIGAGVVLTMKFRRKLSR